MLLKVNSSKKQDTNHHSTKGMNNDTFLIFQIESWLFASNSKEVRRIVDIKYLKSLINEKDNHVNKADIIDIIEPIRNVDYSKNNADKNNCIVVLQSKWALNQQVGVTVTKVNKLIDEEDLTYIEKPQIGILYDDYFVEKYAMLENEIIGIININKIVDKNCQFGYAPLHSYNYKLRF